MTDNYPAPREIPPEKILLAKCGDPVVAENRARREIVEDAPPRAGLPGRGSIHGNIRLVWSSPGFEIAGSVMIWTNGYWAVWYASVDGTRHGRRYRPDARGEAEARAHFRRLTTAQS
ncbi:MAG TPA: hypothetical protein VJ770_22945 [Stellaceae bacterium]|nr:hypothetical protein [Stellaceae bacterium]